MTIKPINDAEFQFVPEKLQGEALAVFICLAVLGGLALLYLLASAGMMLIPYAAMGVLVMVLLAIPMKKHSDRERRDRKYRDYLQQFKEYELHRAIHDDALDEESCKFISSYLAHPVPRQKPA